MQYAQIDRQDLVHELNISYRDVRILDPLVATPYPTALLIRERALVVNLEAVRMIICPDQCYVSFRLFSLCTCTPASQTLSYDSTRVHMRMNGRLEAPCIVINSSGLTLCQVA